MTALAGWENFYMIVGSSAGALIGLQFVVITLIAGTPTAREPTPKPTGRLFHAQRRPLRSGALRLSHRKRSLGGALGGPLPGPYRALTGY